MAASCFRWFTYFSYICLCYIVWRDTIWGTFLESDFYSRSSPLPYFSLFCWVRSENVICNVGCCFLVHFSSTEDKDCVDRLFTCPVFRTVFQGKDLHVQNKICLIVPKIEETIKKIFSHQIGVGNLLMVYALCMIWVLWCRLRWTPLTYTLYNVLIADFFFFYRCNV